MGGHYDKVHFITHYLSMYASHHMNTKLQSKGVYVVNKRFKCVW